MAGTDKFYVNDEENLIMKKWRLVKKLTGLLIYIIAISVILAGCGKESLKLESGNNYIEEQGGAKVRVGSLKGATSIGLLYLMDSAGGVCAAEGADDTETSGESRGNEYEFTMATQADELLALMVKGELDVALVPANVASILYQKTEGGIAVVDINTLGVLYMVTGDESIAEIEDLKGRKIYLTGKGTTPDYVLHYILEENGLVEGDYTLDYKSEATEVAAVLAQEPEAIGLLPQPFVTAACLQNEALQVVFDMNEEWDKLQGEDGSRMVTGVTVVRREYLEQQEKAVEIFLTDHAESVKNMNENVEEGAALAVAAGIIAKEPIAVKAIPECNIACMTGVEMQQALSGYLEVLYEQAPEAVGGSLPEEDFYYVP